MLDAYTLLRTHPPLTTTDTKRDMLLRSVLGCFCRQKVVNDHKRKGMDVAKSQGVEKPSRWDIVLFPRPKCVHRATLILVKMEFEVVSSWWIHFVWHQDNG